MKLKIKSYGEHQDKVLRTVFQLHRTQNKIASDEAKFFLEHGLTYNQFKVLEVLYHRGDLSIGEITKLTLSTPGNITVVVKNLKRDGWITSIRNEKDKRSTLLSIEQKGRDILEGLFPDHIQNLEKKMSVLSDEELDTLCKLLRKVQKNDLKDK
ncbi:MarR family winged helix-turn-helix transcriptional regulator [Sulfurimonas marina]|uniref:MarR family transcriptional regulator n=1 Tax=Sulfurimonas marina TaxID=2590551 RepID=A0A7M1AVZ5_9BACT|nr:MarR family transcriptional regulator [Sulfurimonas marina]QOP40768.1 MarR family transcriptional regulator [Sulfurimonas marina]